MKEERKSQIQWNCLHTGKQWAELQHQIKFGSGGRFVFSTFYMQFGNFFGFEW